MGEDPKAEEEQRVKQADALTKTGLSKLILFNPENQVSAASCAC
jgi:hypothetical protein